MTTEVDAGRWSRQRWGWLIGILFLLHLALIRLLPARSYPAISDENAIKPLRLVRTAPASGSDDFATFLGDPTLFALPHLENASGAAWLQPRNTPFRVTNSVEPPRWLLANAVESLPSGGSAEFITPRLTKLASAPYQPESATRPLPTQPVLAIEGPLSLQRPPAIAPLPLAESTSAPKPCVIQIWVNSAGQPVTQTILESSGDAEVDRQCSAFVKASRFLLPGGRSSVADDTQLVSGRLTFRWEVVER